MTRTIFYAIITFIAVAIMSFAVSAAGIQNPGVWISYLGAGGIGCILGYVLGVKSKKDEPSNKEK